MSTQLGRLVSLTVLPAPVPPSIDGDFSKLDEETGLFATQLRHLLKEHGVTVVPGTDKPVKVIGCGTAGMLDDARRKAAGWAAAVGVARRFPDLDVDTFALSALLASLATGAIGPPNEPNATARAIDCGFETSARMKRLIGELTAAQCVEISKSTTAVIMMSRAKAVAVAPVALAVGDEVTFKHPKRGGGQTRGVIVAAGAPGLQGAGVWRRGKFGVDASDLKDSFLVEIAEGHAPGEPVTWRLHAEDLTKSTAAADAAAFAALDEELDRVRDKNTSDVEVAEVKALAALIHRRRPIRVTVEEAEALIRLLLKGFAPLQPRPEQIEATDAFLSAYLAMRVRKIGNVRLIASDKHIAEAIAAFLHAPTFRPIRVGDRVRHLTLSTVEGTIEARDVAPFTTTTTTPTPIAKPTVRVYARHEDAIKDRFETAARVMAWFGATQKICSLQEANPKQPNYGFGAFVDATNAFRLTDSSNLGLILDERFVCVDFSNALAIAWAEKNMPPTPLRTKTPSGGEHWFYGHPGGRFNQTHAKISTRPCTHGQPGTLAVSFDVMARGDGAFSPLPGSYNAGGGFGRGHRGYYAPIGDGWSKNEAPILPVFDSTWLRSREEPLPSPSAFASGVGQSLQGVTLTTKPSGTPAAAAGKTPEPFKLFRDPSPIAKFGPPHPSLLSLASSQRKNNRRNLDGLKRVWSAEEKLKDRIADLEHAAKNAKTVERYYLHAFVEQQCAADLLNTGSLFKSSDRIVEAMAVRKALRCLEMADAFASQTIIVEGSGRNVEHIAVLLAFTTRAQIVLRATKGGRDGAQVLPLPAGCENVKRLHVVGPRAHLVCKDVVVHVLVDEAVKNLAAATSRVTAPQQHVISLSTESSLRAVTPQATLGYFDPAFTDNGKRFTFHVGTSRPDVVAVDTYGGGTDAMARARHEQQMFVFKRRTGQADHEYRVILRDDTHERSVRYLDVGSAGPEGKPIQHVWRKMLTPPGARSTLVYAVSCADALEVDASGISLIPLSPSGA